MRLLDIGCGWGGMLLHAAEHHGVRRGRRHALASRRPSWPRKRVAERGLADRVEIRLRRLPRRRRRSVRRDQLDRHVRARRAGASSTATSRAAARCSRPEGRLLNHGISRPHARRARSTTTGGHRRGSAAASPSATCSPTASCTRSATSCRRCSAPGSRRATSRACASTTRCTLRCWVRNLEAHWDDAVAEVGAGRARVWRLYMAAAARRASSTTTTRSTRCSATATDRRRAAGCPSGPEFT